MATELQVEQAPVPTLSPGSCSARTSPSGGRWIACTLSEAQTQAPAKGGETASADIVIEKGPTPFPAGPIVGEFQQAGFPAAIEKGQIVIRKRHVAVAVRRPNGGIAVQCNPLSTWLTGRLRRLPLARGVIILVETLTLGMRALSYSANVGMESPDAEDEDEQDEIGAGAIAGMMLLSLAFAVGLFFLVPLFASRPLEGKFGNDLLSNVAASGA